jgi:hypothetical protein
VHEATTWDGHYAEKRRLSSNHGRSSRRRLCYNRGAVRRFMSRICAEVVELADTPSKSPNPRVFSKFRAISQVANKSDTYPHTD